MFLCLASKSVPESASLKQTGIQIFKLDFVRLALVCFSKGLETLVYFLNFILFN